MSSEMSMGPILFVVRQSTGELYFHSDYFPASLDVATTHSSSTNPLTLVMEQMIDFKLYSRSMHTFRGEIIGIDRLGDITS